MAVSKLVRGSAVTTLLAFGLVACSEGPTAPAATRSLNPAGPLMSRGYGSFDNNDSNNSDDDSDKGQSGSRSFSVVPGQAVRERLGDHVLLMPADVVCDPASSGYGPSFWDLSCSPADQPIEVTATWTTVKGRVVISFEPNLRFVPSDNPDRWVTLWAKHGKGIDPAAYYAILWRDPSTRQWVDESENDLSQRAEVDARSKIVARRLKHFSDYEVWFGFGSYNVTSGLADDLGGW